MMMASFKGRHRGESRAARIAGPTARLRVQTALSIIRHLRCGHCMEQLLALLAGDLWSPSLRASILSRSGQPPPSTLMLCGGVERTLRSCGRIDKGFHSFSLNVVDVLAFFKKPY